MSLNPCSIKEAFLEDLSGNRFVKDYDNAAYEHNYLHKQEHKNRHDPKYHDREYHKQEWFETEQGMIYIGGGLAALIIIVIVLHKMRNK